MIDRRSVFEIHRLADAGLSQRQIAKHLNMGRGTVSKYLKNPDAVFDQNSQKKASKLEPYYDLIDDFLTQVPDVNAPVVLQRLKDKGFDGSITIVRDYLRQKRGKIKNSRAFIRFESEPGKQIQVDWGHFGSLVYGSTRRKLYALTMTECYSRMLYVHFTHSQKQEVLHQALVSGFIFFSGTPKELVVDNMLTAVTERYGKIIRFNEAFLDFLRPFKINPIACNVRAPHEKGKIERSIGYVKQNFWPLRTFDNLGDVQQQVLQWLKQTANIRIHQTTGERPAVRFDEVRLNALPEFLPDYREICQVKVHKDFAVRFDNNTYTAPPWTVGKNLVLKADGQTVTIWNKDKKIAVHTRCWERKKRIELQSHAQQVKQIQKKLWQDQEIAAFASLGSEARHYLQALADAGRPIKKTVSKLIDLKDEYGETSLIHAIKKAITYNAWGADYIENILYQEMTPHKHHPPVRLKDEALNRIRLTQPSLADYDACIIRQEKEK